MFCPNCGKEVFENNIYCERCGTKLKQITEERDEAEVPEIKAKNGKKAYNKWIRGLGVIIGTLTLLGSTTGFQYYFESKLLLVLIIEIIFMLISIFLILLGLFPVAMNARLSFLDIESNFPEIVVGLLIAIIIIGAIEPQPPGGWWGYYPFSTYQPETRFVGA